VQGYADMTNVSTALLAKMIEIELFKNDNKCRHFYHYICLLKTEKVINRILYLKETLKHFLFTIKLVSTQRRSAKSFLKISSGKCFPNSTVVCAGKLSGLEQSLFSAQTRP